MFNWAIGEGIEIVANPVFGSNRPAQPASRERVLTSEELKAVWRACADDDHGRIIRLLMLTAQRRGEVGGMRRSELNLSGTWEVGGALQGTGMWTLPAQRTKNAREHAVPLIGAALALLPPRRAGTDLVFGSGRNGFVNWGKAKAELDDRVGEGVASWVVHDLRRSVATGLADLGVLPHIIEAVLNHVSGHKSGVAGVYNRARYAPEVRDALAKWSEHLSAIVA